MGNFGGNRGGMAGNNFGGNRGGNNFGGNNFGGNRGGMAGNGFPNRPEIGSRGGVGNSNFGGSRVGAGGNNVGNRVGGGGGNRVGGGGNTINNVNRGGNNVNVGNRGGLGYGAGGLGRGPYGGYHNGWVHGYWHGNYGNGWRNWGYGAGLGLGLGMGLAGWGWGMGSMMYGWGYAPYVNPYYDSYAMSVPAGDPSPSYDYSAPIDTTAAAPATETTDPAMQAFDNARASFLKGDYQGALGLTDQALKSLPNDATLHEFRALTLFALAKYDQAAAVLYAVLSVGPGWDWSTLIGLYPNVDVYTQQLRALEAFRKEHPESAPARFVLAYQYLTQGHNDAAARELKEIVQLQPSDKLSASLLAQLSGGSTEGQAQAQPASAATPTEHPGKAPANAAALAGSWKASPDANRSIALTLGGDGKFSWAVTNKGKTNTITGESSYGNGLLTLAPPGGSGAMVGEVALLDNGHLNFRMAGAPPSDPGLNFAKTTTR